MSRHRGWPCVPIQSHTRKEWLSQSLNSCSMIPSLYSDYTDEGSESVSCDRNVLLSQKLKLWTSRLLFQQSSPHILLQLLALGKREKEWKWMCVCVCVCSNEDILRGVWAGEKVPTLHWIPLKQMLSVLGYCSQSEQWSRASIFWRTDVSVNSKYCG